MPWIRPIFGLAHPLHSVTLQHTESLTCDSVRNAKKPKPQDIVMMKLNQLLMMASVAIMVSSGASKVLAQDKPPGQDRRGRGNFDPAEMQQRMMERYQEVLEI